MWAFNKNYELRPDVNLTGSDLPETDSDEENYHKMTDKQKREHMLSQEKLYKTYTYDFLIKLVLEYCSDEYLPVLRSIVGWKIDTTENVLQALLINRQDIIACDYAKYYLNHAAEPLMIFCMRNLNEIFLKFALNSSIFGTNFFSNTEVRQKLIDMLVHKAKTELVLNVLLYADFTRWPQKQVKELIEFMREIVEDNA